MKNLTIRKYPAPVLRQKSVKIKDASDPEIQKLIPEMVAAMRKEKGVGLAAPQIGQSIRLCIVQDENRIIALINPRIKAKSTRKIIMEEGCLSFPGTYFPIERSETIKVRYLDEAGAEKKLKAGGLLGRAIQHEIDHLDGVLIIDRSKKIKKVKL